MADEKFLKTVAFGGYDKGEVEKLLNALYSQLFELKNELDDTKLELKRYTDETDVDDVMAQKLAAERKTLALVQTENTALTSKLEAAVSEIKKKDSLIYELNRDISKVKDEAEQLKAELSIANSSDDVSAMSKVFAEAKRSASLIVAGAKKEAAEIELKSRKAAENIIIDAENKAAVIVYEAEKSSADIRTEAYIKSGEISETANSLRLSMINDISAIGSELSKLKGAIEEFAEKGYSLLEDSEEALRAAEIDLRENKDVSTEGRHPDAEYPAPPVLKSIDHNYDITLPDPVVDENQILKEFNITDDNNKSADSSVIKIEETITIGEESADDTVTVEAEETPEVTEENAASEDATAEAEETPEVTEENTASEDATAETEETSSINTNEETETQTSDNETAESESPADIPESEEKPIKKKALSLAELAKKAAALDKS